MFILVIGFIEKSLCAIVHLLLQYINIAQIVAVLVSRDTPEHELGLVYLLTILILSERSHDIIGGNNDLVVLSTTNNWCQ